MKSAVIYARYSSNAQTEQSIEGQLTVCEKYARDNNLLIVNTYIDRAMTGTNDNRAAFQQMLSDSKNAPWEIVLVYAIDRFGRNSTEVILNKKKLTDNGKILISATQRTSENIDGTKNLDGILLENVYIGIAEYYSAEMSQKIRRGQDENRKKGLYCGGGVPYGYKVVDKKIIINEGEAEIVRYIFSQYAIGVYVPQIIKSLTEKGVLYRGKPFNMNMLYNILRKEKYTGIYRHNGEVFDNIYPKIVDVEVYQQVQQILSTNFRGTRSLNAVYLLRDKVKCGYCGKPFSAESGTSKTGKKIHYYKCRGRKTYRNGCQKTTIRKDDFENFIIDIIISKLCEPTTMNGLIKNVMALQDKLLKDNPRLGSLQRELRQVETSLNNLVAALERGIMSNTTNKRLHELETRQIELEKEISIEKCKTIICLNEVQIKSFYEKALRLDAQMLIGTLIKEVIVFNDKIEIYLNSPITTSPDISQGFLFYKEKLVMPVYIESKKEPYLFDIDVEMIIG